MEAALIKEGMPVEEIQRLCDVHAAVFKGSIEEIHHPDKAPGHPIHTFKLENEAVRKYIYENVKKNLEDFKENDNKDNRYKLIENFNMLWDLDKHYSRKENLLFPYLEKYGVTAPPKVMWGVDDEVRAGIKETKSMLQNDSSSKENIISKIDEITNKIQEMIFKEENILFPLSIDSLTEDEWYEIESDSDSIGYCLTGPADKWKPARADVEAREQEKEHEDFWIKMGDLYILIRYFAVRDDNGEFLGILEVSQNIKPIQEITGEKRLISD